MKTSKTRDSNIAGNAPVQDDDLLYAEDAEGNPLSDADVIAAAERVETLRFTIGGATHKIEIRLMQIPTRLTNRLQTVGTKLALEAGFKPGENPVSEDPEDIADEAAQDPRLVRLIELTEESEDLRRVHAEIAVAATVRDDQGRFRTSVPQFRTGLTADALLNGGGIGDAYIDAVKAAVRPSSTPSTVETPPTTGAK